MDIKIGERLKELRKSKGWTQVQVAAKMGLTDSVISFYERQERAPSP